MFLEKRKAEPLIVTVLPEKGKTITSSWILVWSGRVRCCFKMFHSSVQRLWPRSFKLGDSLGPPQLCFWQHCSSSSTITSNHNWVALTSWFYPCHPSFLGSEINRAFSASTLRTLQVPVFSPPTQRTLPVCLRSTEMHIQTVDIVRALSELASLSWNQTAACLSCLWHWGFVC